MNTRENLNVDDFDSYPAIDNRDANETWIWLNRSTQLEIQRCELFTPEVELRLNLLGLSSEELEQNFRDNNEEYEEELREATMSFLSDYNENDYVVIRRFVNEIVRARLDYVVNVEMKES